MLTYPPDLAFNEAGRWIVVDFKTDEELRRAGDYGAQVGVYGTALTAATGQPAKMVLIRV